MATTFTPGKKLCEGKTKQILELKENQNLVYIQSMDNITAGDGVKRHEMAGKSKISTSTTSKMFELLNAVGIKTHFIKQNTETSFIARRCDMIPIEWVTRRVATGSFLKRCPGVEEGYRFSPLKLETFFKDDANHDPQWSTEQIISAKFKYGNVVIGREEVEIILKTTQTIFQILEKAWQQLNCCLIDMKIEYGVDKETGEILLSDVIDNDAWRLWPSGDKRLMVDKQIYRNLATVTSQDMQNLKDKFQWVADQTAKLLTPPNAQVAVLMGSITDKEHCMKILKACQKLGLPCELRVTSAHKGTDDSLNVIAHYESEGIPTVFIAVAGRSNGLGPVTSGNSPFPVINCPPIEGNWGTSDIWSSLRVPSGLGCGTVLSPDSAALLAGQIIGMNDHVVWSRIRAQQLNTWIGIKVADKKLRDEVSKMNV